MKSIIIATSTILVITLSLAIYLIASSDNNDYRIVVTENALDLSSFGIRKPVKLSGIYEQDLKELYCIGESIHFEQVKTLDSNGLPVIEEGPEIVPRIEFKADADMYGIYMANVFSQMRFCYGSIVLSDEDSLTNGCWDTGMPFISQDTPVAYQDDYSVEIFISEHNSFCINKDTHNRNVPGDERICFEDMALFKECAVVDDNDSSGFSNLLGGKYAKCKSKAARVEPISRTTAFPYSISVDRHLHPGIALKEMKKMRNTLRRHYGLDGKLKKSLLKMTWLEWHVLGGIEWQVE